MVDCYLNKRRKILVSLKDSAFTSEKIPNIATPINKLFINNSHEVISFCKKYTKIIFVATAIKTIKLAILKKLAEKYSLIFFYFSIVIYSTTKEVVNRNKKKINS